MVASAGCGEPGVEGGDDAGDEDTGSDSGDEPIPDTPTEGPCEGIEHTSYQGAARENGDQLLVHLTEPGSTCDDWLDSCDAAHDRLEKMDILIPLDMLEVGSYATEEPFRVFPFSCVFVDGEVDGDGGPPQTGTLHIVEVDDTGIEGCFEASLDVPDLSFSFSAPRCAG